MAFPRLFLCDGGFLGGLGGLAGAGGVVDAVEAGFAAEGGGIFAAVGEFDFVPDIADQGIDFGPQVFDVLLLAVVGRAGGGLGLAERFQLAPGGADLSGGGPGEGRSSGLSPGSLTPGHPSGPEQDIVDPRKVGQGGLVGTQFEIVAVGCGDLAPVDREIEHLEEMAHQLADRIHLGGEGRAGRGLFPQGQPPLIALLFELGIEGFKVTSGGLGKGGHAPVRESVGLGLRPVKGVQAVGIGVRQLAKWHDSLVLQFYFS